MLKQKTSGLAILLLSIFLLGSHFAAAQSKQSNNLYAQPARLLLKGDDEKIDENNHLQLLRETFYPIGWSKDGKFAYLVEPPDEACGCYFAQLVIQDLRNDKIVWQHKYSSEEGGPETLEKYWAKNQKEFSAKLAQYGIKTERTFDLQNPDVNYKTDVLTPKLEVNTKLNEEGEIAGDVALQMISKTGGKKTIYKKNYDPRKYDSFREAELAGSLLSPYEPRVAVIIIETHRGWEGPPNVTEIKIIGATLTNGFR